MNDLPTDPTQEEVKEFIRVIAEPTFKYILKRITNNILKEGKSKDMSMNSFISIIMVSLASLDANMIQWIEKFYLLHVGQSLNTDKLRLSLLKNINEQLGIKTH